MKKIVGTDESDDLTVLPRAIQSKEEGYCMATSRATKKTNSTKTASPLMVRLDHESKQCLAEAASLRQLSVSDYVRAVTVSQARREVRAAPADCRVDR